VNKPCVLVVDDERRYRELLELNLTRRGYRVLLAGDGVSALNALECEEPDLIILDLMLPDMDGYDVCRRVREHSIVPIIMLTAKAEEAHKVQGLRLGADDYITKPFGAEELLARVGAVLRRSQHAGAAPRQAFVSADLCVDFDQHQVRLRGQPVDLSATEYKLLQHLALNAGRILVQEDILRTVWGPGYESDPELLHTAVHRLRQKIEDDPTRPGCILTKRGIGYWLAKSPAA